MAKAVVVDCPNCEGTGKQVVEPAIPDPNDPDVKAALEAEQQATGKKPKINPATIPTDPTCRRCGGAGTIPFGGML